MKFYVLQQNKEKAVTRTKILFWNWPYQDPPSCCKNRF